jgi:hypothetical protein
MFFYWKICLMSNIGRHDTHVCKGGKRGIEMLNLSTLVGSSHSFRQNKNKKKSYIGWSTLTHWVIVINSLEFGFLKVIGFSIHVVNHIFGCWVEIRWCRFSVEILFFYKLQN